MRTSRALLARLIPVAMLATMLVVVGGSPANATSQVWPGPVQLTDTAQAQQVLTRPNGDVMVGCTDGSASNGVKFVTASSGDGGSVARTDNGQTIQACDGTSAVAGDGTVYAPVSSTPNPYATWIQRYDLTAHGAHQWSAELSTTCGNVWNFPSSVVMCRSKDSTLYLGLICRSL